MWHYSNGYHTTIDSSVPTVVLFTILEMACAWDGALWRLHFTGNAASVAKLRYIEHVSVGDGCRLAKAVKYTYNIKQPQIKLKTLFFLYAVSSIAMSTNLFINTGFKFHLKVTEVYFCQVFHLTNNNYWMNIRVCLCQWPKKLKLCWRHNSDLTIWNERKICEAIWSNL